MPITITPQPPVVVRLGVGQAIAGPPGPPGSDVLTYVVAAALSGHVVVAETAAGLVAADSNDLGHMLRVVGISTNAASAGGTVNVQARRTLTHSGWAFTPGQPVFLGAAGALTQSPGAALFSQIVGVALTPTSLFVAIQPPVRLT